MKNVAIVSDDINRRVRIKAAKRDTSVSDFERRKQLQADVIASIRHFRAADRFSREEIHVRNPFRKPR